MMTQLQRDAMRRAQRGDWQLADAIELLHPARTHHLVQVATGGRWDTYALLWGVLIGGRLRAFVYGEALDEDEDHGDSILVDDMDVCGYGYVVKCVVDLNGEVIFGPGCHAGPPDVIWQSTHITQPWAKDVVDAYYGALPPPSQNSLMQEAR